MRAKAVVTIVVTLLFVLAAALAATMFFSAGVDTVLMDIAGDSTLTGRDRIWKYALSRFWQSPIVGVGYGSLWNVGIYSLFQQHILRMSFIIKEGHNGYIDVITELGVVGLFLMILYLITTIYRLRTRIACADVAKINFVAIFMWFAIVLINITESTLFRSGNEFWLYFLLVTHASTFISPYSGKSHSSKSYLQARRRVGRHRFFDYQQS
jgi:O-antigen ligase